MSWQKKNVEEEPAQRNYTHSKVLKPGVPMRPIMPGIGSTHRPGQGISQTVARCPGENQWCSSEEFDGTDKQAVEYWVPKQEL